MKTKRAADKTTLPTKPQPATKVEPKAPGVIATIAETVSKSGKAGVSKEEILAVLKKAFPDRDPAGMAKTIRVQLPTRIVKGRFEVVKTEDGKYRRKA
jgi:hypothetical protein